MDLEMVMLNKSKEKIESMFDEIAPTYDRLNHLFTLNIDRKWRKEIVKYLSEKKILSKVILDIASGTGDLTSELLDLNPVTIYAADISKNMLEILKRKVCDNRLETLQADAAELPFKDNYFDLITIGFGIRNFEYLNKSLNEMRRVLKPDGCLVILEMFRSDNFKTQLFNIYFGKVIPFFGNKISKSKYAYSYLFKSVDGFLTVNEFICICEEAGFNREYIKNNFLGIVNTVYLSNKNI